MAPKKNRKKKFPGLRVIKTNNNSAVPAIKNNNISFIPAIKDNNYSGDPANTNNNNSGDPAIKNNNYSGIPVLKINGSAVIPSPEVLAQYNYIIPGLAERIVAHAEKQSLHRTSLERKLLISNIRKSYMGLVFGFLIGSLGIGGGIWLTFSGFNVTGIVFSSASLVSLVMSFIYGSQNKKNIPDSPS